MGDTGPLIPLFAVQEFRRIIYQPLLDPVGENEGVKCSSILCDTFCPRSILT